MAYTTIKKPSDYFNTKLYTGNGSTGQSITGVGFEPSLTWLKLRSTTGNHGLFDAVRGATKRLQSNQTNAEDTVASFASFDSDGFTLSDASQNNSGETFASWNWKANGTGSANTDGSISSTVSVNTTSGFSIVSYTGNGTDGATVGHGLGVAPKVIMIKRLTTGDWLNYHSAIGGDKYLILNKTDAQATASGIFSSSTNTFGFPTSYGGTNPSSTAIIAYCFAEKTGYSKFGSYVGNGNNDGTFVYTGFKPGFVITKITSAVDNWILMDNKRLGYNGANYQLLPNSNLADQTPERLDLLSNGFKCRNGNGEVNGSGQTYIYMAFAEQPLIGDNPATAR
jgi:hypothetical protein